MLDNISKMMRSEMPVASAVFYGAATLVAGRKFCVAAGYKVCAAVAKLTGRENAAEWNKASDESMSLAKKNVTRDVAAVAGFIGLLAVALGTTEAYLLEDEKEKSWPDSIRDNLHYYAVGAGAPLIYLGLRRYRGMRKMCEQRIDRSYQLPEQHRSNSNSPPYTNTYNKYNPTSSYGEFVSPPSSTYGPQNFLRNYPTKTGF